MGFFGLQESDQQNITENNIRSSVNNSNSNITDTTVTSRQISNSKIHFHNAGGGFIECDTIDINAGARNENTQNISVISKTNTNFDTTLTNNITNDLKNDVKQKTPGLGEGGLFSSQVNNQLNKAINNTKNDISNKFFIKRRSMVSTDQDSGAEVNINNEGHIKCSQFDIETDATNIAFTSFLLDTVDDASAKSAISNTIKNTLSNTATQAGGGLMSIIASVITFAFIAYITGGKKAGGVMSGIDRNIPQSVRALLIFVITIGTGYFIYYTWWDESNYELNTDNIICNEKKWWGGDGDGGYKLKDEFNKDSSNFNKKLYDNCTNSEKLKNEWKQKRQASNFSSTDSETEVYRSTTDFKGINQYNKIDNSISVRGVIRELDKDGNIVDIDYTRLNENPYSNIDCGEDGLDSKGNNIDGCRTIEQDFGWEQLLKQSCGCCGCDPDKIGYMDEWVDNNPDKKCGLDNSRPFGVFCDKNIDIIQPGSGYETGQDYNTTCRNPNNDSSPGAGDGKCKKRNSDGTISDIDDDDVSSNIKVSLISETDCVGLSSDLMKDPIQCNHGGDAVNDTKDGTPYVKTGCCYNEPPSYGIWSTITDSLFGEVSNTGERCTNTDGFTPTTPVIGSLLDLIGGVCPENCTKADSCRINYMTALKQEADSARTANNSNSDTIVDITSQRSHCSGDCEYKIMGVQELRVTEVPSNHIEDPDNVYTISKKPDESQDMKPVEFNKYGGVRSTGLDSVWQASSLIHFTDHSDSYPNNSYKTYDTCEAMPHELTNIKISGVTSTNNLCDCKFRRLPACIKDENGNLKSEFGCSDTHISGDGGGECLECESTDGVPKRATYDKQLKDKAWGYIVGSILLYLFIFAIFNPFRGGSAENVEVNP